MESFLTTILGNDLAFWVSTITQIVGVFSLIATRTPNTVDNKIAQVMMEIINFLGANLGKAKNE